MSEALIGLRRLAAAKALSHVESRMIVGLGSGNTIACSFLPLMAEKVKTGILTDIFFVPSSHQIEFKALEMGLKLLSFNQVDYVDVTIDSADILERGSLTAVKGGGGALLLEKVLCSISRKVVLILDERKLVERVPSGFFIPAEVLPSVVLLVKKRIERAWGISVRIRTGSGKVGPIITDSGNAIMDIPLPEDCGLEQLDSFLNGIPGVFENGIFKDMVSIAYVGTSGGVLELRRGK